MNSTHPEALGVLAQKLNRLLMLREAVRMMTVWLFIWGVVVLALKISGVRDSEWLAAGVFGFIPLVVLAGWRQRRNRPDFEKIRADYDRLNGCGGVMMAQECGDVSAWLSRLPAASVPKFRWRSGRAILLFCLAAMFAATVLLLPDRLTHLPGHRPLEIGQIVEQLRAEVRMLAQEKIVPDVKADDLEKQLTQLQADASGYDPNKTWEALDHIKQANGEVAKQASEEAVQKTESLTEAETLAKAMAQAAENGMAQATASQAAQDLASLLNAAKLEDGVLKGQIPPELLQNLSSLNGLNADQMQKLLRALEQNKSALSMTMSNLANLKMIDPQALAKCENAGHIPNFAALSAYLAQCNGHCESEVLFSWLQKRGRGGPGGGGPEAPMDWDNDTPEANLKFQPHALPPSAHLSDAQMVGISQAAPQLSAADVSAEHGALDDAAASGGSAHSQLILPEHRQAVRRFFERAGK